MSMTNTNNLSQINMRILDCGLGFLPALTALKEENNNGNPDDIALVEFIIRMKQLMVQQESFYGPCASMTVHDICNQNRPEKILFGKTYPQNIPDQIDKIYKSITRTDHKDKIHNKPSKIHFASHDHPSSQRCDQNVEKMKPITDHAADILNESLALINSRYRTPYHPYCHPRGTIVLPNHFAYRVETTVGFAEKFEKLTSKNIQQYTNESQTDLGSEFINGYDWEEFLPLCGTLEQKTDEDVLYVMSYYSNQNYTSLENEDANVNNFLPYLLEHNSYVAPLIQQYANHWTPHKQCHVIKLLAKPHNSSMIYAVFLFVFNPDIITRQLYSPLSNMHEYIQNNYARHWINAIINNSIHTVSALKQTISIWNIQTSSEEQRLSGHKDAINDLVRISDNLIASASDDGTIKIWDTAKAEESCTLTGHLGPISTIDVTPDGKKLVSCSNDKTIRIWDVKDKTEIFTLRGDDAVPLTLTVTPNGNKVISSYMNGSICIWDIPTGKLDHKIKGFSDDFISMTVTPDGNKLVLGSTDGIIRILNIQDGKETCKSSSHTDSVNSVVVTPDGKKLISCSDDKTVRVLDISTCKQLRLLKHKHSVKAVSITHDGKIVSGSWGNILRIWDINKRSQMKAMEGKCWEVLFDPVNYQTFPIRNGDKK